MANKRLGKRIVGGFFFAGLVSRAAQYAKDPDRLKDLTRRARQKVESTGRAGPFRDLRDSLALLFRLVRAYAKGEYREIPWQSLVLIVAAILYFLTPIDVIPDFVVALGYLDDAAVLAWVMSTAGSELERFRHWEASRGQPGESLTRAPR
jgi:uncharacterized membrane protein YkvA (DUF1232 family)